MERRPNLYRLTRRTVGRILRKCRILPPPPPPPVAEAVRILCDQVPGFAYSLMWAKGSFDTWRSMPPETYAGKDVLDIGCGVGSSSACFLERGARFVWGIDPVIPDALMKRLGLLQRSRFTSGPLKRAVFGKTRFDLIYAHFVTEHIHDLPADLSLVFDLLKPGGRFVGVHDNFYGPMGGHDHAFMGPAGNTNRIVSKAVPCWKSPLRCEASAEFRASAEKRHDWTLTHWRLTPEDCSRCLYYHRAQVWGHLQFQEDYPGDYPGDFYKCSTPDGGLNKVTPFQLRQYFIEAGFDLVTWEPHQVENIPTAALLERFAQSDLQTSYIVFAGDKPAQSLPANGSSLHQTHKALFERALKKK
jgi:2-polyprenyl-6-hydroxyphenyl methylase/3-demethylubiquinone-9 3-methyltransferase